MKLYRSKWLAPRKLAAAVAVAALSAGGSLPAATSRWLTGVSGNWLDGTNWSTSPTYPNNGFPSGSDSYDVVIDAPAAPSAYTITLNAAAAPASTVTVDSLTINSADANVIQSSGTFTAANGIMINDGFLTLVTGATGATIKNTTISASASANASAGAPVVIAQQGSGSGCTFSGVTLSANVAIQAPSPHSASLTLTNGSTLDHTTIRLVGSPSSGANLITSTLDGVADIVLDGTNSGLNGIYPVGAGTSASLTLGPGITVRTGTRGGFVGDYPATSQNQGMISARTSGQVIALLGKFTNQGSVEAINGGIVSFETGQFTQAAGNITVGAGSIVRFKSPLTWSGGSIGGDGLIATEAVSITGNVTKSGTGVMRFFSATFSMAAGKRLDITAGKLILPNGGASPSGVGSWNGSAYTGISGLVASGRNGNATTLLWDGAGIVTTQSDATNGNYTSIAVARGSEARPTTASATALWSGLPITGTDTLVMYTYGGDANLDGKINIDDYVRIDQGIAAALTGWSNGDFNYDGKINIDDYTTVIDANIGNQNGFVFPTAGGMDRSSIATVPEPAGLSVAFGGVALLTRRRRRR